MHTPSSSPVEHDALKERGQRHPLLVLSGFALLGLAAAMLLFGGSLLNRQTNNAGGTAAGLTGGILEQAGELAPARPASEVYSLTTGVVSVGDNAPDFILSDLSGQSVRLSDFRGQPVIINFWATWCPPCRVEMPDLQRAFLKYTGDDLVILALDQNESAETVAPFFYDEMKLTFTPLLDINGAIAAMYGIFNFPTSVFVNGDGQVTAVHRGLMTFDQIETYLSQTLNQ
ncbi:MAG: hypothetical protein Fur0021_14200 [Candidatus Promineifilaceae bacterium]